LDELEHLDHILFECKLAKYVWGVVKCATSLVGVHVHFQDMSVIAVFWPIWKARNATAFITFARMIQLQ
jgi:hypothetical protein